MSPQTVNAYYNPSYNEIVFPGHFATAFFYNYQADEAVNYGGIGAVIGHRNLSWFR
jgi:endothelin-converting enzyme/putative endopeptidase